MASETGQIPFCLCPGLLHSCELRRLSAHLVNQTAGTTDPAMKSMPDYRKRYVELSQGRGGGTLLQIFKES